MKEKKYGDKNMEKRVRIRQQAEECLEKSEARKREERERGQTTTIARWMG
jgi:hypothetical protein